MFQGDLLSGQENPTQEEVCSHDMSLCLCSERAGKEPLLPVLGFLVYYTASLVVFYTTKTEEVWVIFRFGGGVYGGVCFH